MLGLGLANEPASGQEPFPVLRGPYLGQQPPGMQPVLFAPGIISTDLHDDFSPAFTPDGRYLFFVVPEPAEANRRLDRRGDIEAFRGAGPRPGGGNVYWVDATVVTAMRPQRWPLRRGARFHMDVTRSVAILGTRSSKLTLAR